jgi:hypothetical protein
LANTTIWIGVLLIILGLGGYFGSASHSPTALIPAGFGIVLAALGFVARDPARRKLAMHIAVTVGLIGFLFTVTGMVKVARMMAGREVQRPTAAIAQAIMAVLTGVFVALCVKSFVDARRSGTIS